MIVGCNSQAFHMGNVLLPFHRSGSSEMLRISVYIFVAVLQQCRLDPGLSTFISFVLWVCENGWSLQSLPSDAGSQRKGSECQQKPYQKPTKYPCQAGWFALTGIQLMPRMTGHSLPALLRVWAASEGVGTDATFRRYSLVSIVLAATSHKGRRRSGDIIGSARNCVEWDEKPTGPLPSSAATHHHFKRNELRRKISHMLHSGRPKTWTQESSCLA